jgi:hypothetical protein
MQHEPTAPETHLHRITLVVNGLDPHGARAAMLRQRLEALPGVFGAYVSGSTEMAFVVYDPEQLTVDGISEAVRAVGLEVGTLQ